MSSFKSPVFFPIDCRALYLPVCYRCIKDVDQYLIVYFCFEAILNGTVIRIRCVVEILIKTECFVFKAVLRFIIVNIIDLDRNGHAGDGCGIRLL